MTAWNAVRRSLYRTQRAMGDVSAAGRGPGPLARRLVRRSAMRRVMRGIFGR